MQRNSPLSFLGKSLLLVLLLLTTIVACDTSIVNKLWSSNSNTIQAIVQGRFVQQLAKGTLSKQVFDYYIYQDELYCNDYARSLAVATGKTVTNHEFNVLYNLTGSIIDEHDQLSGMRMGSFVRNDVNKKYCNLITSVAWKDQPYLLAVATSPCMTLYMHVAREICKSVPVTPQHPYYDWISFYNSTLYETSVNQLNNLINWYYNTSPDVHKSLFDVERALDIYSTAMEYEQQFFEASFQPL